MTPAVFSINATKRVQSAPRSVSGLTVEEWCAEKGVKAKTYYNHVRRVREEALETLEQREPGQIACITGNAAGQAQMRRGATVFAAMPLPQGKGPAITVWIGDHAVDIQNGADDALVEQTIRVVSRL